MNQINRKGFAIVEVLVAFIILTTALALLTYAQKAFNTNTYRLQHYENVYITLLSLKNKVDIELTLGDKTHFAGKLNQINFTIDLKKVREGHNLTYDDMQGTYNEGSHTYTLYKVTIHLVETGKTYVYYKMRTYFDKALFEQMQDTI